MLIFLSSCLLDLARTDSHLFTFLSASGSSAASSASAGATGAAASAASSGSAKGTHPSLQLGLTIPSGPDNVPLDFSLLRQGLCLCRGRLVRPSTSSRPSRLSLLIVPAHLLCYSVSSTVSSSSSTAFISVGAAALGLVGAGAAYLL